MLIQVKLHQIQQDFFFKSKLKDEVTRKNGDNCEQVYIPWEVLKINSVAPRMNLKTHIVLCSYLVKRHFLEWTLKISCTHRWFPILRRIYGGVFLCNLFLSSPIFFMFVTFHSDIDINDNNILFLFRTFHKVYYSIFLLLKCKSWVHAQWTGFDTCQDFNTKEHTPFKVK